PSPPGVLGRVGSLFPYELVSALMTNSADGPMAHPTAHLHTQWPGSGDPDDPLVHPFAAGAGWLPADFAAANAMEREHGAALLDEIGPAILMSASAGAPMGWLTADARPSLVSAIVALEQIAPPVLVDPNLGVSLDWGLTASSMTFDPPAASSDELKQAQGGDWTLHAEPPPEPAALTEIPIAILESEAPWFACSCPATAAFLEQAGCR